MAHPQKIALLPHDDSAEIRALFAHDPAYFAARVCGDDLWPMQQSILRAVGSRSRTAVKACHASGKTMTGALAVLWWLARYEDGIVVTTAPTWEQVRDLMW